MNRGRQHVSPVRYNRAEVATRGLACPFAKSDPGAYMNIDVCKPSEGFKEPRLLFEHVWRKHTRFYHCDFCPLHWSISTPRKEVRQKKEEHWKICDGKLRGVLYLDESDDGSIEFLNWKQQELFEKTKSMRDVEAKLKALYKACGKPVPETYHATAAFSALQPQMNYGPGTRTTTPADQQPISHGEGIFEGFSRPRSEISRITRQRTTPNNLSKVNAALLAGDSSSVSGANRPMDADSGYSSMPRNNGDTDDVLYAEELAAQHETHWHAPHDVRLFGMSGSPVVTASPGHIASDESFSSMHDHVVQGCFGGCDTIDPLLYGGMGSSARRDNSLMGMGPGLSNLGPETTGQPLNPMDYIDLDADLLEF